MMWSRWRHALLFAALAACAPLWWLASGAGRFAGVGVASFRDLALAGPDRVLAILQDWSGRGLAPEAVGALLWDLPFLVALVLLAGLAAMALARPLPGRLGLLGPAATAAAMLAGTADVAEDVLLLAALDQLGRDPSALAWSAAWLSRIKLALWFASGLLLLTLLVLAVARLLRAPKEPRPLEWLEPEVAKGGDLLSCDLVMKGGITSGVVYPGAVWALAKRYRFMSIGGSSAGAIAAAVTAAAEYRRRTATTAEARDAGFEALRELTRKLAREDALFHLFQPAPACAPLFDVMAAVLRPGRWPMRALWGAWTALAAFPLAALVGLLPIAAVGRAAVSPPSAAVAAWSLGAGAALATVTLAASVLASAVARALWKLPRQGFGLCPGPTQGDGRAGPGLADWLADAIDEIAFGEGAREKGPLTLGHLWCGGPPDQQKVRDVEAGTRQPAVRFEVLTTSLTHGRPYRIPFDDLPVWFAEAELGRILPARIVRFMVDHPGGRPEIRDPPPVPVGTHCLPAAADLPVVFLARMSLSFPVLLAAPQLTGLRLRAPAMPGTEAGDPIAEETAGVRPADARPAERRFEPHWFSDGGISSNFPIHFFDQPIPEWPTFGLDLGEAAAGTPDTERVWLARHNGRGIGAPWRDLPKVWDFGSAVGASLHAWLDNMQKRAPGYRDRIARINLTREEGGLNLRMPSSRIERISRFGNDAGRQLADWFEPRAAGAPPPAARGRRSDAPGWAWDNHRWIRFRSTMALMERFVGNFSADYQKPPVLGARTFADMIGSASGPPPSYDLTGAAQRARTLALADQLTQAGAAEPSLAEGAPRPVPELRIIPKV